MVLRHSGKFLSAGFHENGYLFHYFGANSSHVPLMTVSKQTHHHIPSRRYLPTVSPQSAKIAGPGMVPFTVITSRSNPSGDAVVFVISNQYSRTTPVSGVVSYQFVLISLSHQTERSDAVFPAHGARGNNPVFDAELKSGLERGTD